MSLKYKILLDTLLSSVERVAEHCWELKIELIKNKNMNTLRPCLWGFEIWVQWNLRCTMPSQLLSLLGKTEGWSERSQNQAGIPVKILKRHTTCTAYARLVESVRLLCSRHCNSRLSLLRCWLCAWRYNRETWSSASWTLVPFGAKCLEQFACTSRQIWRGLPVTIACQESKLDCYMITVFEAHMAHMMNRKRKPKRLVQG